MKGVMQFEDEVPTTFDLKTLAATVGDQTLEDFLRDNKPTKATFEKIRKLARHIKSYIGFDIRRRMAIEKTMHTAKGHVAMNKLIAYAEGL